MELEAERSRLTTVGKNHPELSKLYLSNEDASIKLFDNKYLEKLTKVHPATPLIIFVPVVIFHIYVASHFFRQGPLSLLFQALAGLLFWTFFEYMLHRFIFHFVPKTDFGKKLIFLFHGIHHAYPRDSRRLVMPPSVGVPLALLVYVGLNNVLPRSILPGFFAGFIIGYLFYDMGHFAIHHFNFNSKIFQSIKKHHYRHHYGDPARGYGVSSPLWDFILGTKFN